MNKTTAVQRRRRFTTILWDVDGTLLDFVYAQRCAVTKCFQTIGREVSEEMLAEYAAINDSFWKRLELGEITKEELLVGRFQKLFERFDIHDADVESFRLEYQHELGQVYAYLDDSLTICRSLKGKVKQYVVTNGIASTQLSKLKLSGLGELMEELFISETIGAPKPQKEYFDYCLKRIAEKDGQRILLVGDSLTSDIKGGVLAGLATCWYRPEGADNTTEYQPDYEISDLHQIYDILQEE